MTVTFEGRWNPKREKIQLSSETIRELNERLDEFIGSAESAKGFCEGMKTAFGDTNTSSSASWARSDLSGAMRQKQDDGAEFLRCFWDGIVRLSEHEDLPDEDFFNEILIRNNESFRIEGEEIQLSTGDVRFVGEASGLEHQFSKDYVLGDQIGQGGFGVVHRLSKRTSLGSFDYAIKILHPSPLVGSSNSTERFKREVAALSRLQHRAVVPMLESGYLGDGRAYYLMPLITGKTLRDATEGMEPQKVLRLFLEILSGVKFMHSNDIYHRDLKPSNIIVRVSDGQPIVLDFGCAFFLDELDQNTITDYAVGSMAYLPPEVLRNPRHRRPGHDIYSIGVMLYECIARSLPEIESYAPLAAKNDKLSPLDDVIQKATGAERNRHKSVTALRTSLLHVYRTLSA